MIPGAAQGADEPWLEDLISRIGEPAVGFLIALETVVPPIPSEVVLPFAGFQVARGEMSAVGAWLAATAGSLLGAWLLYGLGVAVGRDRLADLASRRWFFVLGERDLERGERYFAAHGAAVVLVGRCIPLVRSVVSIPAGLARMPLPVFTLYTAIGSGVWNAFFIAIGWHLEDRWEDVEGWMRPIALVVLALLVAAVAFLAFRKLRRAYGA